MGRKPKEQTEETAHGNGHVTLDNLAATVADLCTVVNGLAQSQQKITAQLQSGEDEFAPDDADLRDEAEADAKALTAADSGITITGLGKSDGKSRASEKLVDAMFNTPRDKLDEMTDVRNDLEAAAFAGVRTYNQFIMQAFSRKNGDPPVLMSDMFLDNFEKLKRSIGGKHMMRAMAMSQIEKEREEARENSVIFGGMGSD